MDNSSSSYIRKVIKEYHIFDAPPEKEFDDISRLAAYICHTPVSLISIFDEQRQYLLSHHGWNNGEVPNIRTFYTPENEQKQSFLEIKDAESDEHYKSHPLFHQNFKFAYYAHVPLVTNSGDVIGLLSVMDEKPGSLNKEQVEALRSLANQVMQLFELQRKKHQLYENKEKLSLESARLSHIIDATQVGTWEWNVQTGLVKINDRWAEMLGYTREELEPLGIDFWYQNIHPKDRKYSDQKVQECFNKKAEYYDIECRLMHKDGHLVWINDRGRVVSWTPDGEPLLMVGTHTDITERKNNEIQFKAITNNIPGIVFRYKRHADGRDELLLVSEGAEELWGISAEDAMNDNQLIWQRYHEEDLTEHLNSINQSAETNSYWEDEWRYHHPDGSLRWHKGSGNPTQLEDGSTIWDSIILDITEQKNTEARLNNTLASLKERVKEQACLNKITQLGNQEMGIEDLLTEAVKVLPEGWQYPEVATAVISYRKRTYRSSGHQKSNWMQSSHKETNEGMLLKISVAYQRKMPEAEEGPFLKEERQLLESIINSLVLSIDKTVAAKKQELILNSTEEGIYGIDADGLCTFINPSAAEMIGYTVRECLGRNMHELIHYKRDDGSEYKEKDCPIYSANKNLEGCRVENDIFWRKEGQSFPVRYSSTPIVEAGEYRGTVIVFNDISERLEAEKKLQDSERRFRALVQEGTDLIAIVDAEGNFMYTSPSYYQYLGLKGRELRGVNAFSYVHPDDLDQLNDEFNQLKTQSRIRSTPYRLKHIGEGWRWMQSMGTNLQDDPNIRGFVVNTVDITELIEAQHKLRASEARYRGLYESQTNYVIRTDMEGNYTYVNKKFVEEFGWIYPDGNILGKNSMASIMEYDHSKVIQTVEECIAQPERVFKVEIDKPTEDGNTATTLWDFVCVLDGNGNPSEIQCMGIDITDRIQFEKALKENNERFELIMQASSECICDLNLKSDELYLSDGFSRQFGLEIKSLEENKEYLNSRIHPDDRSEVLSSFNNVIYATDKDSWTMEYRLQKADGKYAVIRDKAIIMRDEVGDPYRVLGVIKDISEKYFYKELETIERDVMEYAIQPGVSLKEVMDKYLLKLEALFPDMRISVLRIVDEHLQPLSAPSLPVSYIEKLNGLQIGPKAGSCGTAAYNKSKVIVANVFEDERWEDYTAFAREYDFTACWSQPIFNAEGEVIATFANYYNKERTPGHLEEHAIVRAQRLLSILMAKFRYVESIKKSNERFTYVNKATNDAIYDWDVRNDIFHWGESFTRIFGHPIETSKFELDDWAELVHPEDVREAKESLFRFLNETDQSQWTHEYRFQRNNGTFAKVVEIGHLIRDNEGRPDRMIGVVRDVSDIRKLEELLDRANELARIGAWELNLIKDSLYWSPMTHKIHEVDDGYKPELETALDFYETEHREIVEKAVTEAIEAGKSFDFELPIITAKGNRRWVRTIGQPEFVSGECIRVYGSFQDIHQRKSAEMAMQEALDERNNILESIGEAFFALNEDYEVLYWNSSAEDLIEVGREELLGKNLWDKFPEAKSLQFYTEYDRAMKENVPVHFEEYYPPAGLWLEVNGYPTKSGISVFFKDITEKKQSEERLRESNERFEKVTQATNDAIWDYDIVNDEMFWGKGFHHLFGHNPDKLEPSYNLLISFIHPDDRDEVKEKIRTFIKDPKNINWFEEYRFKRNDGTYAFVIDRAYFIRNNDGKAIRVVGAMTDITYRKEYEDSLRKLNEEVEERVHELAISNAELEQFAYVASHDLQEPLRMVSSFLTQLEKKYKGVLDDKAQKYIHYAVDGAQRMRQIILDLLEYSRVGNHNGEKMEVPLQSIVDEVKSMFQRKIEKSGANIHCENLPVVRSYHTPLLQIFQNLISNSLKYIEKGKTPEIHISGESQKNNWLICIKDNGIGMDPQYYEKIFVIFQRLHAREEYSGTGMGLAIVKKNVDALGGEIWVESQTGAGCTFYLSLPRKEDKTIKA